jgi:hypothetical protein
VTELKKRTTPRQSGTGSSSKAGEGVESDRNSTDSSGFSKVSAADAAKASVAVSLPVHADADLRVVVEAWPDLPDAIKAGVLAIVNAANHERGGTRGKLTGSLKP